MSAECAMLLIAVIAKASCNACRAVTARFACRPVRFAHRALQLVSCLCRSIFLDASFLHRIRNLCMRISRYTDNNIPSAVPDIIQPVTDIITLLLLTASNLLLYRTDAEVQDW